MRVSPAFVLLLCPLAALAADPYPNRAGALSAEEVAGAKAALQAASPGDANLPLIAGGRRAGDTPLHAYAVFAGSEAERPSAGVIAQRRMLCTTAAASASWKCTRVRFYQYLLSYGTIAFVYSSRDGEDGPEPVQRVLQYVSHCLANQYQSMNRVVYP